MIINESSEVNNLVGFCLVFLLISSYSCELILVFVCIINIFYFIFYIFKIIVNFELEIFFVSFSFFSYMWSKIEALLTLTWLRNIVFSYFFILMSDYFSFYKNNISYAFCTIIFHFVHCSLFITIIEKVSNYYTLFFLHLFSLNWHRQTHWQAEKHT